VGWAGTGHENTPRCNLPGAAFRLPAQQVISSNGRATPAWETGAVCVPLQGLVFGEAAQQATSFQLLAQLLQDQRM